MVAFPKALIYLSNQVSLAKPVNDCKVTSLHHSKLISYFIFIL